MIPQAIAVLAALDEVTPGQRVELSAAIRELVSDLLTAPTMERAHRGEVVCAALRKVEQDSRQQCAALCELVEI
jgi:DNA-binding transcriptional regulator YdaS (Cro superfamily)